MKTLLRIIIYLIVFVVVVGGTGAIGYVNTMNAGMSEYDKAAPLLTDVKVPKYDDLGGITADNLIVVKYR